MRTRSASTRLAGALMAVAVCVAAAPAPASAAPIIEYVAVDLPDVTPGDDLWRYDYLVSGYAFAQHEGFDIFFSPDDYADLAGSSPDPDWDVLVVQPDPGLPDNGIFSAIANVLNPSLAPTFSVEFTWLGIGTPGKQPFDVTQYDALHDAIIQINDSSQTRLLGSAPEPVTLLLLATGLGSLAFRRRRYS